MATTDKTAEPELDTGHAVRTAVLRLVLPSGTVDDQEFDLERACRELVKFGDVRIDELRLASRAEARHER